MVLKKEMNMYLAMVPVTRVSGKVTKDTGLESKFGLMGLVMRGIGKKIKLMAKGLSGM